MTAPPSTAKQRAVRFTYKNHEGKVAERHVQPIAIRFGATKWHPEAQWLLEAFDNEREAVRWFALKDVTGWKPA